MGQVNDAAAFDFIVVGSGPAGSAIASRLARSAKAPTVLLLEAGSAEHDENALVLADRYTNFVQYPQYNYSYKTAPQAHLGGRSIDYSRGRGLGGSSRINFACYTIGPSGDFEQWADLVQDKFFDWENSRRRYNKIESYHTETKPEYAHYLNLSNAEHGKDGPLHISFPGTWERGLSEVLDAAREHGYRLNPDMNSGDPIGVSIVASTANHGIRSTAAGYLLDPPKNLTILADSPVTKILIEGSRSVGVVAGGQTYRATKDVILSAGALDTPKLLLLSGIGPKSEITAHGIESVHDLPAVGKGLEDHFMIGINMKMKSGGSDRPATYGNPEALAAARAQFSKDKSGPLSVLYGAMNMGEARFSILLLPAYLKPGWIRPSQELQESDEYRGLPDKVKQHLARPTVPAWELGTHGPPLVEVDLTESFLSFTTFLMNTQSKGSVTLASSDPKDPPLCDPNLLSHPYDRRLLIEAVRRTFELMNAESLAPSIDSVFTAPKSMSEEDIVTYGKETGQTSWHMSCTAKMGLPNDPEAVVDTHFRVKGLEGLRVVDMSVAPFVPNCHTVAWAYQIGEMGAERLIEEYSLA